VNESYLNRNTDFDQQTYWLMGDIQTSRSFSIDWEYRLSNALQLSLGYAYQTHEEESDNYFSLELKMDY